MNTTEELSLSAEYLEASLRFRQIWLEFLDKAEVKNEIVNMVKILEDEGFSSRTKAIEKIMDDHKDLEGFSRRTIYRQLPDTLKDIPEADPKRVSTA